MEEGIIGELFEPTSNLRLKVSIINVRYIYDGIFEQKIERTLQQMWKGSNGTDKF